VVSLFGGYKQSEFGRELGIHSLPLYTQIKSIYCKLQASIRPTQSYGDFSCGSKDLLRKLYQKGSHTYTARHWVVMDGYPRLSPHSRIVRIFLKT
jgi:hypothetical protein